MRRRLLRFAQKPMEDKAYWERIAKKYNGLGLQGLSMALGGLMLYAVQLKELLLQYALCVIMYNSWVHITFGNNTPFRSIDSEVSRDEQELHFSWVWVRFNARADSRTLFQKCENCHGMGFGERNTSRMQTANEVVQQERVESLSRMGRICYEWKPDAFTNRSASYSAADSNRISIAWNSVRHWAENMY